MGGNDMILLLLVLASGQPKICGRSQARCSRCRASFSITFMHEFTTGPSRQTATDHHSNARVSITTKSRGPDTHGSFSTATATATCCCRPFFTTHAHESNSCSSAWFVVMVVAST
jgi:hypothetical protein